MSVEKLKLLTELNQKEPSNVSKLIEPATILALTIGAVYYLGWNYVDGYCQRIGLNHESMDFPTPYYVRYGFLSILSSWVVISPIFLQGVTNPKSRLKALLVNIPILITGVLIILFAKLGSTSKLQAYMGFLYFSFVVLILIVLYLVWEVKTFGLYSDHPAVRLAIIFLLYLYITPIAVALGENKGKALIEGETYDALAINFVWESDPIMEVECNDMILLLHKGEKFYVVKKEKPAPAFPTVFIVPDSLVKYTSLKRIK